LAGLWLRLRDGCWLLLWLGLWFLGHIALLLGCLVWNVYDILLVCIILFGIVSATPTAYPHLQVVVYFPVGGRRFVGGVVSVIVIIPE
jgi:hypothetical protein